MFEGAFSPMHLIVILVIVLIIFGPKKLPDLGNSLGRSIKNFKKAVNGDDSADPKTLNTADTSGKKPNDGK